MESENEVAALGRTSGRALGAAAMGTILLASIIAFIGDRQLSVHADEPVAAVNGANEVKGDEPAQRPTASTTDVTGAAPLAYGEPSPLPLPSSMSPIEYEKSFLPFITSAKYQSLGWRRDKGIRDTGPFIDGKSYGTHPAVRIFYSPEIIRWLVDGRKNDISDGAMIVKEHYATPAIRHADKSEEELWESLTSWTVMVKDSSGSHDGWYWSEVSKKSEPKNNHEYPFDHPSGGFGHYCIRCHASTKSPAEKQEYTFAALRNIEGFPGTPLIFRVDDSWRNPPAEEKQLVEISLEAKSHRGCMNSSSPSLCQPTYNDRFAKIYGSLGNRKRDRQEVQPIPPVTHDWVTMDANKKQSFITSNQCMSCHAGLVGLLGPSMFVEPNVEATATSAPNGEEDTGWHVSPYGEWRWTPMGLAGRDPVFYAQMELEQALLKTQCANEPEKGRTLSSQLTQTCLSCHGVMGKHEFHHDHPETNETFGLEHVAATSPAGAPLGHGKAEYGALARDGVSCVVCHRAIERPQPEDDSRSYLEYFLATSITGNLCFAEPGNIFGPFEDKQLAPYAMEHAVGYKPQHSAYIKSSRLCGSCHTVNLPIFTRPYLPHEHKNELAEAEQVPEFQDFHHHVEQATYLEWLNSAYQNEFGDDNPKAQSCQDCHMSKGLVDSSLGIDLDHIETRIAAIQDHTYPDAENLASHDELNVRLRKEGYSRHNFVGLNVFLVQLFDQFDDILGVRKFDFMTGSKVDLQHAIENFLLVAKTQVADVSVAAECNQERELKATVDILSKVGHRFPSGVGFRRAFVELLVLEQPAGETDEPRVIWSSGQTDSLGVLLGDDGQPLASEFFATNTEGKQAYQPHHEVITSSDQVQVYETLLWDTSHRFTTSFVGGCDTVKDNRILPQGWSKDGPDPSLNGYFLKATMPGPVAANDPAYISGSGSDQTEYRIALPADVDLNRLTVSATLYYQSMPPYFLKALFDAAPNGPATQRLHYMLSNMRLENTPIENWKLKITSDVAPVKFSPKTR
jgi:cytochrome c551/c552